MFVGFFSDKMTTVGDRVLNISLPKIGEKSLFTKDLEDALRNGVVDFVVHSLKDLPTALPDGMAIGAVLKREDARDALVLAKQHDGKDFKTLPEGSIIGMRYDLNLICSKIRRSQKYDVFFLSPFKFDGMQAHRHFGALHRYRACIHI